MNLRHTSCRVLLTVFSFFLCITTHAHAKIALEEFTLGNGMEVIVLPNHRVPAVTHMLWFKVGAADDPQGKSGLAHYHEHMMFQGTDRHKAGEYASMIAANGGVQNAFTGADATSYFVNIAKEQLPLVMGLEADRMRGLSPKDEDADKEKQVIIEERRERVENNPQALLNEQMMAALFRHHPYRIPVIGWMHEMEGLSKDDALDFHTKYYHASNAILIVSGDITAAELKPLAEKYYGTLPKMPVPTRQWTSEPPQRTARHITMQHANVKQPEWTRSYSAESLGQKKDGHGAALFLLAQLMGGGKTSALYRSIVVEQKLASAIDVNYGGFSIGPAVLDISAIPEAGVSLDKLEKAIDAEIARILKKGFAEKDVARAKTLLKAESIYARDGLTSMARIMGWVRMAGLSASYFTGWEEMIEAVSEKQIMEAAHETLAPEASVTGWLLPEGGKP